MKKRLLSLLLAVSLMAGMLSTTAYADTMPFTDLDDGAWYMSAVQYAYDNGLMNGMTATTFAPDTTLSRAMFVTILGRMAGIDEDDYTGSTGFTDAPAGAWYAPYVKWAAESGIVNGMTPTTFAPDANITREQMAAILVRYVENNDLYLPASSKAIASFADEASVSEWAEELVDQARSWGIFAGNAAGNFTPQSSATRAEAATVFMRLEEYLYLSSPEADSLVVADEEHIATDAETGIRFVDNTVLAYTQNYLTDEEKQSIADLVDGEIVGQLSGALDMLQIQVEVSTLAELEAMEDVLETSELVHSASYDILLELEAAEDTSTSDTDGTWWKDAINLDDAWEKYEDYFGEITVGVIDANIDIDNAALGGSFQFANATAESRNDDSNAYHGTNACYFFSSVVRKAQGYFASCTQNSTEAEGTEDEVFVSTLTQSMAWLVEKGCKVINCSAGNTLKSQEGYAADQELLERYATYSDYVQATQNSIYDGAVAIAEATCELLYSADGTIQNILFVQAAGNGYNGTGSDAIAYTGLWSSITSANASSICAKYGMTYQELKAHILVVTSVSNSVTDNNYSAVSGYNYGSSIDICAPGAQICGYDGANTSGTSFSAPIVAGVAALVWSLDSDLTATQVRKILTNATEYQGIRLIGTPGVERESYPMVNALAATDAALQTLYEGTVVDSATNEPVEGVTIHFYDENDVELESTYYTEDDELLTSCVSDETGKFIAYVNRMAIDHLTVEMDGYIIAELTVDEEMTKYNYSATALEEEEKQTPYQLGEIPAFVLYAKYAEVVKARENIYGEGERIAVGSNSSSYALGGIALVQLLDFDGDGVEELLIGGGYASRFTGDGTILATEEWVEVWAYIDGTAQLVYSADLQEDESYFKAAGSSINRDIVLGSDGKQYIQYTSYNGKIYMIQGYLGTDRTYYYFGYTGETFARSKILAETTGSSTSYQIDGVQVTEARWNSEWNLWNAGLVSYTLSGFTDSYTDNVKVAEILQITANTKETLGMS